VGLGARTAGGVADVGEVAVAVVLVELAGPLIVGEVLWPEDASGPPPPSVSMEV
jgi:hypothetical protein